MCVTGPRSQPCRHILRLLLQSGHGYPKCLLVFQCPVSNTWKSNCRCACEFVCANTLSLHAIWQQRPCPHTPSSTIYVFAQPCDLTRSQATSTLGHVTRQAEVCPAPHISRAGTKSWCSPPLIHQNSHLASFETRQLSTLNQGKDPSADSFPINSSLYNRSPIRKQPVQGL